MREGKQTYQKIFFAISSLAALFVLTETVLQSFGTSICFTEGCRLTAQYARFGDISILLIGLLTFSSLAGLSLVGRFFHAPWAERFINLVLIVALTCEGFFMGYLVFRIHTFCLFCVIVFGLMVTLGVLRLLAGEKELIAGFASLAAVFSMLYLVLPVGVNVSLPENERLILFYSKECKHCAEIRKELEDNKIMVKHLDVNEYSAYLKSMGIEHVPTLFVNDTYQKVFLTGKDAIRRYLITCSQPDKTVTENTSPKTKSGRANNRKKTGETGTTLDIFNQQGITLPLGGPASDEGMCKENEICK